MSYKTDDWKPDDVTRALPHSVGCEKSILSSMLVDPNDWIPVAIQEGLTAEYFYLPAHSTLFKFLIELYTAGAEIELVSLIQKLLDRGLLDRVGGPAGVCDLHNYAPTHCHFRQHLQQVRDKYVLRSLIQMGNTLIAQAYDSPDEPMEALQEAGRMLSAIDNAANGSKPPLSTKSVIKQSFEAYKARLDGVDSPMGWPTLPEIDELIRGLHPGRVVLIGATTGGGKSVLSSQIITLQSQIGIRVLEINYEMRERDSMDRKLIQMSRVPSQAFMDPLTFARENDCPPINDGFMTALEKVTNWLIAAPIFIRKPANRQLQTLQAMLRKEVRENNVQVVAIDYLQKIRCKADSREAELTEISGTLFDLAGELGIAILLLTQVNADGDSKHGIVTTEDCDAFLLIEREKNKEAENFGQHYHILLAKDRHCGKSGTKIPLIFDPNLVRFVHGYVDRKKTAAIKKRDI